MLKLPVSQVDAQNGRYNVAVEESSQCLRLFLFVPYFPLGLQLRFIAYVVQTQEEHSHSELGSRQHSTTPQNNCGYCEQPLLPLTMKIVNISFLVFGTTYVTKDFPSRNEHQRARTFLKMEITGLCLKQLCLALFSHRSWAWMSSPSRLAR